MNIKSWAAGALCCCLTSLSAVAATPSTVPGWYTSAGAGYSTGWNATGRFVFPYDYGQPPPQVTVGFPPTVEKVDSHSRPLVSIAVGYAVDLSHPARFLAEAEGLYLPQKFSIFTESAAAISSLASLTRVRTEDDYAFVANIGLAFPKYAAKPSLMLGVGRNTSTAARSSTVWQAKAGLSWAITDSCAFKVEGRFLVTPNYVIAWGPGLQQKYEFGSVRSVSCLAALNWAF